MKNLVVRMACMATVLSLAGCSGLGDSVAHQTGPAAMPLSILSAKPGVVGVVRILCIDGRSTHSLMSGYPDRTMLVPGRHHLLISTQVSGAGFVSRLLLDAVAGHHYAISTRVRGYAARIVVSDESTGQTVGVTAGSADEPPVRDSACRKTVDANFPNETSSRKF